MSAVLLGASVGSGGGFRRMFTASALSLSVMQTVAFVSTEWGFTSGDPDARTLSAQLKSKSSMATHDVTSLCSFSHLPISRALRSHQTTAGSNFAFSRSGLGLRMGV